MALTTKRLQWLKWLYPGEAGLQSEQQWAIDKRRGHMGIDHSPGVANGLDVLASGSPDKYVHVQTGRAVDVRGEEVVVSSIVDLDLTTYSSAGSTAYIVAEYTDIGTDPYIVPETAASQYKFLQDSPQVTAQGTPASGNQIELARITFTVGGNAANAANPDSPGNNEIDMRSRALLSPVIGGLAFGTSYPSRFGHVVPVLDESSGWLFELPAGWKVLYPSKGTLNAQLNDVKQGDKYLLYGPGSSFTMDGNITISANNVTIRGLNAATNIALTGAYTLTIAGNYCRLEDVYISNGAASTNPVVQWSGVGGVMSRVGFYGTDDRAAVLKLTGGASDMVVDECIFNSDLGSANFASHIHSDVNNEPTRRKGLVRNCRFNLTSGTAFFGFACIRAEHNGVHPICVEGNDMSMTVATTDSRFFILPSGMGWEIRKNRITGPATPTGAYSAIGTSAFSMNGQITIVDNEISNVTFGVKITIDNTNGLNVTINRNRMTNIGNTGSYTAGSGIDVKGGGTQIRYGTICDNVILGQMRECIDIATEAIGGTGSDDMPNGVIISGNTVRSERTDGLNSTALRILSTGGGIVVVSGNIFRVADTFAGASGIYIGIDCNGNKHVTIDHNSIAVVAQSGLNKAYGIFALGERSLANGNSILVKNGTAGATGVDVYGVLASVNNNYIRNNSAGTKVGIDIRVSQNATFNGNSFVGIVAWTNDIVVAVSGIDYITIQGNALSVGISAASPGANTKIAHNTRVATHNT